MFAFTTFGVEWFLSSSETSLSTKEMGESFTCMCFSPLGRTGLGRSLFNPRRFHQGNGWKVSTDAAAPKFLAEWEEASKFHLSEDYWLPLHQSDQMVTGCSLRPTTNPPRRLFSSSQSCSSRCLPYRLSDNVKAFGKHCSGCVGLAILCFSAVKVR